MEFKIAFESGLQISEAERSSHNGNCAGHYVHLKHAG